MEKLLQKSTIRRIPKLSSGHVSEAVTIVVEVCNACCPRPFSANGDDIRLCRAKTIKSSEPVSEKVAVLGQSTCGWKTRRRV